MALFVMHIKNKAVDGCLLLGLLAPVLLQQVREIK